MRIHWASLLGVVLVVAGAAGFSESVAAAGDEVLKPIDQRFASAESEETPDFQKHMMPLFGRLGCNGRSCHGSFQGRGGFRLSLFGYDFKFDHQQLFDKTSPRVDLQNPDESLIISKPTDENMHEGGQRYAKGSWQHHAIRRWIQAGAPLREQPLLLTRLEVHPSEIWFSRDGEQIQLQAIAVWEDGSREDVTPLCRFVTNDDQVGSITENGLVTAVKPGDTHVVVMYDNGVVPVPVLRPVTDLVGDRYPAVETPSRVDELVVAKLRKLGIVPSELCNDAEFLRRVRLDLTGTLPSAAEVEAFLVNDDANKRAKKIDELLDSSAYAAWWTTKLCDFTGNNEAQLVNATPMRGASKEWYDWIYKRVAENMPYDQLVEGIACASSMKSGQSYLDFCKEMSEIYHPGSKATFADLETMPHYWARQDFVEIEARAVAFAYSFMGMRIQCAQCHKHPFDQWSKDEFHQFKNFFARVTSGRNGPPREFRREYDQLVKELGLDDKRGNDLRNALPNLLRDGKTVPFPPVYNVSTIQRTRNPMDEYPVFDYAKLLGGDVVDIRRLDEPRKALMDWLRSPDNRFFAPAFVNRVWASYFNVGIVNPTDDLSLGNPPSNKALLDYLAQGFIESGFDMKWVHRTIANSRTYQTSWQPNDSNRLDERNFSHAIPRRLPAEVAYDAVQQATASDEIVQKMQTELTGRAIAIPATNNRNNAGGGGAAYALSVFGRSTRDSNCDCDRSMEPTLLQTVFLQNDRDVLQMIDIRRGGWLDQVARELQSRSTAGSGRTATESSDRGLRQQFAEAEAQLERARSRKVDRGMLARMRRRVEELKQRVEPTSAAADASQKPAVDQERIEHYVTQVYLRSLSRYPSSDEMARAVAYVENSDSTINGIRDLLWATLNTKEFIVNH